MTGGRPQHHQLPRRTITTAATAHHQSGADNKMIASPRDHHTDAASSGVVNPDDAKARIVCLRVIHTAGGRRANRPGKDEAPEIIATPPRGSLRNSAADYDYDDHELMKGRGGERRREAVTSAKTRTTIVTEGEGSNLNGRGNNKASFGAEVARAGATEDDSETCSTTRTSPQYHRNLTGRSTLLTTTSDSSSIAAAACAAPPPAADGADTGADVATATIETPPESIVILNANQRACWAGASTRDTVHHGMVDDSCSCVQRREPGDTAVAAESLEEEESLEKYYCSSSSHSTGSIIISGSGGCGSRAAGSAAGAAGAAAGEESIVVYRVPGQTPPAVRVVLGRRPGWKAWDAAVHSPDEWNFQWRSGRFKPSEYRKARGSSQRLNHFPRSSLITRKDLLLRVLRKMEAIHGAVYAFHPDSYVLPMEYTKFIEAFTRPRQQQQQLQQRQRQRDCYYCCGTNKKMDEEAVHLEEESPRESAPCSTPSSESPTGLKNCHEGVIWN